MHRRPCVIVRLLHMHAPCVTCAKGHVKDKLMRRPRKQRQAAMPAVSHCCRGRTETLQASSVLQKVAGVAARTVAAACEGWLSAWREGRRS